jgi:hypothetical protein
MADAGEDPVASIAALAEAIDRDAAAIQRRQAASMQCRAGCSDCCRARLSITRVEAEFLRRGLERAPRATRRKLASRTREAGREMCPALDPRGRCDVYSHRPLICRSYGVPLRHRREVALVNPPVLDVCDLNFVGTPLACLPPEDAIDQTDLDAAVAGIDDAYCERNGLPRGERIPIARILADQDPDATGTDLTP